MMNMNNIMTLCLEIRCDSIIHKQWSYRLGTAL